jgi:hypothetical protein
MPIIPAEKKRYQQTSFIPAVLETVKNPYALPCGHTGGARPNYETGLYECKVCGKPFNLEEQPQPGVPFQDESESHS